MSARPAPALARREPVPLEKALTDRIRRAVRKAERRAGLYAAPAPPGAEDAAPHGIAVAVTDHCLCALVPLDLGAGWEVDLDAEGAPVWTGPGGDAAPGLERGLERLRRALAEHTANALDPRGGELVHAAVLATTGAVTFSTAARDHWIARGLAAAGMPTADPGVTDPGSLVRGLNDAHADDAHPDTALNRKAVHAALRRMTDPAPVTA